MSQRTRKEKIQAITAAYDAGQAYCPSCGTPLNYHRGGLPNSATFNPTTDTITCSRCSQRSLILGSAPDNFPEPSDTPSGMSFTGSTRTFKKEHQMGLIYGLPGKQQAEPAKTENSPTTFTGASNEVEDQDD